MKTPAIVAVLLALAGCKNVAPDAATRALIVDADAASRAALKETVNRLLGTEVLLADDALTASSLLIIERQMPRSIEGSPAQGRTMELPVQFQLVTDGANCYLVDTRDNSRHRLADTRCVAEE